MLLHTGFQSSSLDPGYWSLKEVKDAYGVASIYFVIAINELSEGVFFTVRFLTELTGAGRALEGGGATGKASLWTTLLIPDVHCSLGEC